jgi:regulatory protein
MLGRQRRLPADEERTFAQVYDRALTLLEFRARSTAELRRKLVEKGEPRALVDAVIERLVEQKLLDDAEFAQQFARSKVMGSGTSRLRIVQELGRKGVSRDVADEAVNGLEEREGIDPSASIHRVAAKKWKSLASLDDATRRRRLYAFLARRGFNPDEIRAALLQLGAEADAIG